MERNSIILLVLLPLTHSVAFGGGKEAWLKGELEDEIIGDEIPSDNIDNGIDFEAMLNKISQNKEKPHGMKCGSSSNVPSFASAGPAHSDIDPEVFINVLIKVMGVLEEKVKEAMNITESGVCLQINPIDIFLKKTPYENYSDLLSKSDALEALEKMKQLKAEVGSKMPGI